MSLDAISSNKCQINFTTPTPQDFITHNENKLLAEIEELKSQVEDLQEELGNVLGVKNRQAWEIRFLKEDVKRLSAEVYEKRHYWRTEDTED